MTNKERLEEYLIGDNGYLKSDISNGKVIMLSGKWGSGKTHFWQNIITDELKKELIGKDRAYSYISLYGKSSIEEVENDIFTQIYFNAIDGENIVTKTFSTFTKYSKRYGNLFSSFDFSKLADGLNEEQKDNQERIALERLRNGGIICFDDFERKSKDIDLNDLFGFITQLTLNFNCKVVIILNDNVFEGKEKKIFSNVKEKSVSKFLKYEPSIKELFETVFDSDKRYKILDKHKEIILKTIEETEELNARIYIQVLDNLLEWIEKEQDDSDDILRCLILVNMNFILYHKILEFFDENNWEDIIRRYKIKDLFVEYELESIFREISKEYKKEYVIDNLICNVSKSRIDENNSEVKINNKINFIETYKTEIISIHFAFSLEIAKNINQEEYLKINNFIETGILIKSTS